MTGKDAPGIGSDMEWAPFCGDAGWSFVGNEDTGGLKEQWGAGAQSLQIQIVGLALPEL